MGATRENENEHIPSVRLDRQTAGALSFATWLAIITLGLPFCASLGIQAAILSDKCMISMAQQQGKESISMVWMVMFKKTHKIFT